MQIQSYQIHNVLNVYRRQLSQGKPDRPHQADGSNLKSDSVSISPEGKNQAIMEKVADNVLKKITNVDPELNFDQEMVRHAATSAKELNTMPNNNEFIFNTIAEDNQKETRSIAVDNSQVLMRRLDELAKAAIRRRTE